MNQPVKNHKGVYNPGLNLSAIITFTFENCLMELHLAQWSVSLNTNSARFQRRSQLTQQIYFTIKQILH